MTNRTLPNGRSILIDDSGQPQLVTLEHQLADKPATYEAFFGVPQTLADIRAELEEQIRQQVPEAHAEEARARVEVLLSEDGPLGALGEMQAGRPCPLADSNVGDGEQIVYRMSMN